MATATVDGLKKTRRYSAEERNEARARLLEWMPKGTTVYTLLEHVSSSGMSRRIRVVLIENGENGRPPTILHPNHAAAAVLDVPQAKRDQGDGLVIGGAGMDMGFHLVYSLAQALYGDGYALNHRWI